MASAFFENMFHYNNRSNLADKIEQLENTETKEWKCGTDRNGHLKWKSKLWIGLLTTA